MPKLDSATHAQLMAGGYEYDAKKDKYFNRGTPSWEASEKADAGRRQGAFPSSTIEEFRSQEKEWISSQWSKIKTMREAGGKSDAAESNDNIEA